jgi:hypothetical protein
MKQDRGQCSDSEHFEDVFVLPVRRNISPISANVLNQFQLFARVASMNESQESFARSGVNRPSAPTRSITGMGSIRSVPIWCGEPMT